MKLLNETSTDFLRNSIPSAQTLTAIHDMLITIKLIIYDTFTPSVRGFSVGSEKSGSICQGQMNWPHLSDIQKYLTMNDAAHFISFSCHIENRSASARPKRDDQFHRSMAVWRQDAALEISIAAMLFFKCLVESPDDRQD